ncbi:MAG TPA: hypothetical protein VMW17_02155 [Candidatus Binatia bacterium]|nr:hypothetical protein [Candidatus Binatia bacterium]
MTVTPAVGDFAIVGLRVEGGVAVSSVAARVGVAVELAVAVRGMVAVAVAPGVNVRVGVPVDVASGVDVRTIVGVHVASGVELRVAVRVHVASGMDVRVTVTLGVRVALAIRVGGRVAVGRGATLKGIAAETAAGPGFATAMFTQPICKAVPLAVSNVDDLNVVASGVPFHRTLAPRTKPLPITCKVNAPIGNGLGLSAASTGVG